MGLYRIFQQNSMQNPQQIIAFLIFFWLLASVPILGLIPPPPPIHPSDITPMPFTPQDFYPLGLLPPGTFIPHAIHPLDNHPP